MADLSTSGSITANNPTIHLAIEDNPVAGIEITGTWVATLDIEATINGVGYYTPLCENPDGSAGTSSFTTNGRTIVRAAGAAAIRVHASAFTSGEAVISIRATDAAGGGSSGGGGGSDTQYAEGATAATATGMLAMWKEGTTLRAASTAKPMPVSDAGGSVTVDNPNLDAALSTLATQTTLAAVLAKLIAAPATEATLALIKAKTDNLDVALSTRTKPADAQHAIVDSGTVAVTNANLDAALSTLATQTTLAAIKAKTDNLDVALSTIATQTTLATRLSESDFDTKTGSLTETAPATDIASSGLNGRLQRVAQRLTSLIAILPAALGGTTAANSLAVTLATDGQFVTSTGSLTETAPATDTASSGLNGRLQRIAQRLTSLIALVPAALVSGRFDINVGAAPALSGFATDASTLLVGKGSTSTATLTRPANTTAYASGDEMTDTGGAILQFSGMARANGGGGVITHVIISNSQNAATKAIFELRLYDTTSTPAADNAAFDSADSVNDTIAASFTLANASDGLTGTGGNCVYELGDLARRYKCAGGDTKLYGRIIMKSAYTSPNNSDTWKITLGFELDPS